MSQRFVGALAKTRPYFGLEVMRGLSDDRFVFDFSDLYLRKLIENPESILYSEIFNNQNCHAYRYLIPPSNRLLYFLFSGATTARRNEVYRPIGEYTLSYLRGLSHDHEMDPYNRSAEGFEKEDCWRSPLFIAIRFFDIMVEEALFQNIQSHMWLYYMPYFVTAIVKNYRVLSGRRSSKRFLPKQVTTEHENNNIPKSSILALGQCCRTVLSADNLGSAQKHRLTDMVFRLYLDLRLAGFERYAEVLGKAVYAGGFHTRRNDSSYIDALFQIFEDERNEYFIKCSHNRDEVSKLAALQGLPSLEEE